MSYHLDGQKQVEPGFAEAIGALAEAYGIALTPMRIKLYAAALGDMDLTTVRACCSSALKACRFFPSAAELRGFAAPAEDDRAQLAWAGFARAAEDVGAWASLQVADGAAAHALVSTFGSWPQYCEANDIAVTSKRHEFMAAYRQARREGHHSTEQLPGLAEAGGSYAGDERVWAGMLSASGTVTVWREPGKELAGGYGHARLAAGEAGEAADGEGTSLARRGAGQAGRPGRGRRA